MQFISDCDLIDQPFWVMKKEFMLGGSTDVNSIMLYLAIEQNGELTAESLLEHAHVHVQCSVGIFWDHPRITYYSKENTMNLKNCGVQYMLEYWCLIETEDIAIDHRYSIENDNNFKTPKQNELKLFLSNCDKIYYVKKLFSETSLRNNEENMNILKRLNVILEAGYIDVALICPRLNCPKGEGHDGCDNCENIHNVEDIIVEMKLMGLQKKCRFRSYLAYFCKQ